MVAEYVLDYGDEVAKLTAEELGEATYQTFNPKVVAFSEKAIEKCFECIPAVL